MKEQEANGKIFTEEEVAEFLIQDIGYRAEGRATRQVRHDVLAQDVGFGKTVVVLALIKKKRQAQNIENHRLQGFSPPFAFITRIALTPKHSHRCCC
jgi:hypothetical protein